MPSPESISHVRRDLLDRPVREYADNLREQVYVIWRRVGVKDVQEFDRAVREKKVASKDAEEVRDLLRRLRDAVQKNEAPESESLIAAEQKKLREFFGREITVSPFPGEITPELIEFWRENHFELHYIPPIQIVGEKFPQWQTDVRFESYNSYGVRQSISLSQAIADGLLPPYSDKLTGAWELVDTRPPPKVDLRNFTRGSYPDDDLIGGVIREFRSARKITVRTNDPDIGHRTFLNIRDLKRPDFLDAVKTAIRAPAGSEIRLPTIAEQRYFFETIFPDAQSGERVKEHAIDRSADQYNPCVNVTIDGASYTIKGTDESYAGYDAGFRFVLVFPRQ